MRTSLLKRVVELARNNERICLVVDDLGFSVVDPFVNEFPERFLNAGISEQAMMGISTGWSLAENKIVFVYSLANFSTMRCLEQIRNDCCMHKADVKIVSVGSGITYSKSGYSHYAVEDLAVMGAMPHITIFTPADPCEAKQCLDLAVETPGPAYIRLAKDKEPVLREPFKSFNVGDFIEYEPGNDVCLVGIGTILSECLSAGKLLGDKISTAVIGLPVFKPLNETKLVEYLKKFSFVATVEEHSFYGGLGSVIADIIARYKLKGKLLKFALPEGFDLTGPNNELRKSCGLEAVQIADKIKEAFSHA